MIAGVAGTPPRPIVAGVAWLPLVGLALACQTTGAGNGGATSRSEGPGALVVARAGDVVITAADVAAQMRAAPGIDRGRALEERIVFELLAQEAARHDLGPWTTDEHAALAAVEAQRIVERDIEPHLTREAISDADVRALYERGKRRFVHGRLVQAVVAYIFTGARLKPEPRARAEQNARLLRAALDEHPPRTPEDLEAFVKQPVWSDRNVGSTRIWQDVDGDQPFPAAVARALRPLGTPGALTPLVGDETGYYVAMYLAETPAENRAFEDVAPGLRAEMYEPWRRKKFMQLATELTAGHDIEAFPDRLLSWEASKGSQALPR